MNMVRTIGVAAIALLLPASQAHATDQQDLAVALKTLPLLTNKIASPAPVAVIYDPVVPTSQADAGNIKSIFDNGLTAPGDVRLRPQLVASNQLAGLSSVKIAFLATGLPASDFKAIADAAAAAGVLTISADVNCVKANECVLGVVSIPHVQVYYSPAAAEAAKISFASAFTMLVKQVGSM